MPFEITWPHFPLKSKELESTAARGLSNKGENMRKIFPPRNDVLLISR